MEAFLHRLAFLESTGQLSTDARIRAVREVRAVLTRIRAAGLTRPGGVAGGLGEDFTLSVADVPDEPEPAQTGRDLPPENMRLICGQLDTLTSPVMRTAIELIIDTGRRPEEIWDLAQGRHRRGLGAGGLVWGEEQLLPPPVRQSFATWHAKVGHHMFTSLEKAFRWWSAEQPELEQE